MTLVFALNLVTGSTWTWASKLTVELWVESRFSTRWLCWVALFRAKFRCGPLIKRNKNAINTGNEARWVWHRCVTIARWLSGVVIFSRFFYLKKKKNQTRHHVFITREAKEKLTADKEARAFKKLNFSSIMRPSSVLPRRRDDHRRRRRRSGAMKITD